MRVSVSRCQCEKNCVKNESENLITAHTDLSIAFARRGKAERKFGFAQRDCVGESAGTAEQIAFVLVSQSEISQEQCVFSLRRELKRALRSARMFKLEKEKNMISMIVEVEGFFR